MPALKYKPCVLFASIFSVAIMACNNANMTSKEETSKQDTMAANTVLQEPQLPKTIKGLAGKLFISDGGAGGMPVVFVHAFSGSSRDWQNQLDHLRQNRRAVALDLRGHGQSEAPANNDYSVESLANDIAAAVDDLGLDQFVLVGHSIGGSAAIAYAGRHPGKVAGLLVTGTPGKTPGEQSKAIIASLESEKYVEVMGQYMKKLLTNAKSETDKQVMEGTNKISKQASLALIKAAFKYDPLPDLHKYPGPELIVSKSSEEQANSLHSAFPTIPYKMVEGTSHWIQLDKPGEFNNILDEFLERAERK